MARRNHRQPGAALVVLLFAAHMQIAMAQTSADQAEHAAEPTLGMLEPVVIEEIRFPAIINFPKLALGMVAFEANRILAPEAKLSFRIIDLTANGTPLKVRWESGDKSIPIEPSSDGSLTLSDPTALGDKEATLIMNRRINEVRIEPEVFSPGMSQAVQRMGDLRLLCEVTWAMKKGEFSAGTRALHWVLGSPCKGKKAVLALQFSPTNPVRSIEITQEERRLTVLPNAARTIVYLPTSDTSWSNDAIARANFDKNAPASQATN